MSAANGTGWARRVRDALPLVPFLAFLFIFLIIPTISVVNGAFSDGNGGYSLARLKVLGDSTARHDLWNSIMLSGVTAIAGAVLGALLCVLLVQSPPDSLMRRVSMALSSVLAQFGGVMLAFAFIALFAFNGVLTVWFKSHMHADIYGSGWLYELRGLMLVYTYFQIPLMVIVFLPALEGLRQEWREAATNLGASTWRYWREIAFPILTPAFLGSLLLLFANAFAAYATAAALITQGNPILPLLIRTSMTSEVVLGQQGVAYALALEMVVVVAVVMALYSWLLRRSTRWLR